MPETERGDRKFERHEQQVIVGRVVTDTVRRDVVDDHRITHIGQVIVEHNILVCPTHKLTRPDITLVLCQRARQPRGDLVVEQQERAVQLRDIQVLVVAHIRNDRGSVLLTRDIETGRVRDDPEIKRRSIEEFVALGRAWVGPEPWTVAIDLIEIEFRTTAVHEFPGQRRARTAALCP